MSPVRRDGLILLVPMRPHLAIKTRDAKSYPPRRRRSTFSNLSQAVNCQATIDLSLRDEDTSHQSLLTSHVSLVLPQRFRWVDAGGAAGGKIGRCDCY